MTRARTILSSMALVGLVGTLTACGGQDVVWNGTTVKDADKTMETIDTAWKTHLANDSKVKVRTTDDSRCYFQTSLVEDKRAIGENVLCGPYRRLGSDKTSWDVAPVAAGAGDSSSVTLALGSEGDAAPEFDEGKMQPNLLPWRPDGKEAKLDAVVEEPDAPKMAVGDTLQNAPIPQGATAVTSDEVATPTGRYTVTFAPVPRAGEGEDRRMAPDGGTILTYTIKRAAEDTTSSSSSKTSGQTTMSVKVGDKDYPITAAEGQEETSGAVAVAGDGKNATFAFTYDGLTQTIGADGKRVGTKAAGYYLPVHSGTSPDIKVLLGAADTNAVGWHGSATLKNVTLTLSAYDETKKWAPDGQVWARLKAGYDEQRTSYKPSADGFSDSYDTTAQLTKVTLGGVAATESSFSTDYSGGLNALFLLPADAQTRALKLQAVVTSKGPISGSYTDPKSPQAAATTYTFDGSVSLQG